MLDEIISMLEDMTEIQQQNVLDYVTDEYDEENHEEYVLAILKKQIETGMVSKIRLKISEDASYDKEACKWVMDILNSMD